MTNVFRLDHAIGTDTYSDLKMLTLPSNCKDDTPITFHDEDGNDYQVPADTIFVSVFWDLIFEDLGSQIARIGESDVADNAITREVLAIKPGASWGELHDWVVPSTTEIVRIITGLQWGNYDMRLPIGVFRAGKYVTGETNSAAANDEMVAGTILYGAEVSLT